MYVHIHIYIYIYMYIYIYICILYIYIYTHIHLFVFASRRGLAEVHLRDGEDAGLRAGLVRLFNNKNVV